MKSKKHYAKQYDMTPQLVGKKGNRIKYEVTYKGDYYRYDVSDEKLLRMRILFLAAAVVCAALFVTAGLLDTTGNRRMWVSIPYVCMFLPVAMMVYAAIKQFFRQARDDREGTRLRGGGFENRHRRADGYFRADGRRHAGVPFDGAGF